jgi:hypothetical protein
VRYLYFMDHDHDETYRMAQIEGIIDGHMGTKYLVEYLTDNFWESGVVDLFYMGEKGEVAILDSMHALKRFAQKMELLAQIRQAKAREGK